MTTPDTTMPESGFDLCFERRTAIAPGLVWAAWTTPEHLRKWFTPAPWTTAHAEVDLRPGGIFRTVMRSPEGDESDNVWCILEVVEERRLTWTSALGPGYRPNDREHLGFPVTTEIDIEPEGGGTRYRARVMHASAAHRAEHVAMGFDDGWGASWEQLVALMSDR